VGAWFGSFVGNGRQERSYTPTVAVRQTASFATRQVVFGDVALFKRLTT
jgi:hypothetical protein